MNYFEIIDSMLADFSVSEKEQLVQRFNIDLYKPKLMLETDYVRSELIKRLYSAESKALKKLHPERSFPEPKGFSCSFCGRTEADANEMAIHESGFNICDICVELFAQTLRNEE